MRARLIESWRWREGYRFWTLVLLLAAAFLLGGSSREDAPLLVLLRPIVSICLAIGLYGLKWSDVRRYGGIFLGAALVVLLFLVHLIPLPPSIWMALPGREIAAEAASAAGMEQPWRPIALVPWRAWNSLFALMTPCAALVLAAQCTPRQHARLPLLILLMMMGCSIFAVAQVLAGPQAILNLHPVRTMGTISGFFANRNHFALAISWTLLLLAFMASQGRRAEYASLRTWLGGLAGSYALLLLLLSGSRTGLLMAALAMIALPFAYPLKARLGRTAFRSNAVVALLAIAALLLVIAAAIYFSRAETISRLVATDVNEETRFDVWGGIVQAVGTYFPVGSGVGSFVDVYRLFEPRELLRPTYLNHAHNDWLEWPMETGLPGILLMAACSVGFAVRSFGLFFRAGPADEDLRLARVGAILILLLGLASAVDYPARVPVIGAVAMLAMIWMANARGSAGRDYAN